MVIDLYIGMWIKDCKTIHGWCLHFILVWVKSLCQVDCNGFRFVIFCVVLVYTLQCRVYVVEGGACNGG